MKKLLTLLGSIGMVASTTLVAIACHNKTHATASNNSLESINSENSTSNSEGLQGDDPNSAKQP
ncbi:lipoprotein, partial [Mycoplasma capricolum]